MSLHPTDLCRALADATRLRILLLLHGEGELCVCELVQALAMGQPKISRHLALLREMGVVDARRRGQWVFYALHPTLPDWARRVLEAAAAGMADDADHRADRQRLRHLAERPGAACTP